jgi:Mg-chelatase subunit ChlD
MYSFFTKSNQPTASGPSSESSKPQAQDGANPSAAKDKPLDVVFLQDTTGSQGPYIQSARKAIRDICDKISASGDLSRDLIRFGLIAFRDHPPQDSTYVTKSFGFTSDVDVMQKNLSSLIASGGGDGPEAQTAALAEALNLEWAENAVKMVILITDAPPHGIGEDGDGFDKSPDQNDPLDIARQMAERGITLFVIACEPGLSRYHNAVDFYTALVQITSGMMFPLLMAEKLGEYIVGTAVETIETEKLIGEFEHIIVNDVYDKDTPIEVVTENLREKMKERGAKINTMNIENVYNDSEESRKNVAMWQVSADIQSARKKTKKLSAPRMQHAYAAEGRAPDVSIAPQLWSQAQVQRVVTQSMARNSSVTASGYVSKASGKAVPTLPPAPPS